MNAQTDLQLLRAYAEHRSEPAFTELVRRHVDFVHSAALRMVCDSHLAQDVTQGVFVALAKSAAQLTDRPVLSGWLHRTAQNIAAQTVRTDVRRRAREQEAATMNELLATAPDANWEHIAPHLDAALGDLSEPDRDALLLRYFERKSAGEMAQILGVTDEAAQKRVSRAVEKLREFFSKQKITVGASGLAVLISANAVQSAPVGLALVIANASLTAAGTTLNFMKIATATKVKLAFSAIVFAGAVAAFVVQQQNQTKLRGENESLQKQIAQLQAGNASLSNRIATIGEADQLPAAQFNELLKLRGDVGVLRRQLDEFAEKNRAGQNTNVAMTDSNTNPPVLQIHIKARFLALPKDVSAGWYDSTSASILTSENLSIALKQLSSRDDVETLAEPEVTTISGRQFQMRATQIFSVITNFCLLETNGVSAIVPQSASVETGPVLDAIPRVLSDGLTIELPVIASLTDFLGYAQPTNATKPAYTAAGQEVDVPTVSPQFRVQSKTNSVNLFDDQTLVFALKDDQLPTDALRVEPDGGKSNSLNRHTLVFVTATIIDPAGTRVHEDASFTNIPPQSVSQ